MANRTNKFFLYLKTHKKTGLKYLGQTSSDPFEYVGSGFYWRRHLAKHGREIETVILAECASKKELRRLGLEYSDKWDVVNNPDFANLKVEMGSGGKFPTEKITDEMREKMAHFKGQHHTKDTKKKIASGTTNWHKTDPNAGFKDRKHSKKTLAKMRSVKLGKKHTEESIQKMREAKLGKKLTEEHKRKIGLAGMGKKWTPQQREKFSAAMRGRPKPWAVEIAAKLNAQSKTCPHCGKTVSLGNYARWHGDNCKLLK